MSWLYLSIAILFEIAGTTCMKLSAGFTRWLPSVLILVFYAISFSFFTLCIKKMEISVAYAIWAGAGVALISIIGFFFFQESLTPARILFIGLILVGVVGLRWTSTS